MYNPQLQALMPQVIKVLKEHQVKSAYLFGSSCTDKFKPDSDVDLLIEFIPGEAPGGFGLVDMQDELSATFNGRKIDLAFPSVLANPYRRRAIEPQLRSLYQ